MSAVSEHEKGGSASILQRIPAELWNKILHEEQGFTVEDFKTLCIVTPLFRTICQPLAYRLLAVRGVEVFYGYSFEKGWPKRETIHDLDQWERDIMRLIRAERRLRLVGDDPSLSAFPKTIRIGFMPDRTFREPSTQHPPTDKMVLSRAAYDAFSQFEATFVRMLPSYTQLRRLELGRFPIEDGLLRAIASHPVLHELKLGSCSFPSPTFPIHSLRLLEYNRISQKQAPAAFRLAFAQHLEELQIESMDVSAIKEGLQARPESESMLRKVQQLTIIPTSARPNLLDMETVLSYVPALRRLDIVRGRFEEGENSITLREGGQAIKCLQFRTCDGSRVLCPSLDMLYLVDLSATYEVGMLEPTLSWRRGQNFKHSCTRYVYRQQPQKASRLSTCRITALRRFGF